jgi:hypothetical protein
VNKLYLNVCVQVVYNYCLNGQNLERVSVIRDLGLLKLTFSEHVDVTVSKARQMLGFIMRVGRDFWDPYALKSLYVSLVRSKLSIQAVYGCLIRMVVLLDWREFKRRLFCIRYVDSNG